MARGARARGVLRGLARRAGLEVRRFEPRSSFAALRTSLLARERIELVIDAGANEGQYVRELRLGGYLGPVLSLEPLAEPFAQLNRAAEADDRWECRRIAVGSEPGRATMHIARNSVASSLLAVSGRVADPEIEAVGSERVEVVTLDSIAAGLGAERLFLKLDLQGSEAEALRGAAETLRRARALEIELSFTPIYEGQETAEQLLSLLADRGFRCVGLAPGYSDPTEGDLLQADALLVRQPDPDPAAPAPEA